MLHLKGFWSAGVLPCALASAYFAMYLQSGGNLASRSRASLTPKAGPVSPIMTREESPPSKHGFIACIAPYVTPFRCQSSAPSPVPCSEKVHPRSEERSP